MFEPIPAKQRRIKRIKAPPVMLGIEVYRTDIATGIKIK
jgi:hypothetical protein